VGKVSEEGNLKLWGKGEGISNGPISKTRSKTATKIRTMRPKLFMAFGSHRLLG